MTRPLRFAFAASLLLNVFLVGGIGGGLAMYVRQPAGRTQAAGPRQVGSAGMGLPLPDRERFRQLMARTIRENRSLQITARQNRQAAARLFVQPDFDHAAVDAALDAARAADLEFRTKLEATATDFAAGLPIDEREILAEGLGRGGPLRHPPAPGAPRAPAH